MKILPVKMNAPIMFIIILKCIILLIAFFSSPIGFLTYSILFVFVDYQTIKEIPTGLKRFIVLSLINIAVFFSWTIITKLGLSYPFVTVFHISLIAFSWTILFGVPLDIYGDSERKKEKLDAVNKDDSVCEAEIVDEPSVEKNNRLQP